MNQDASESIQSSIEDTDMESETVIDPETYSVREAANLLGVSYLAVYRAAKRGDIQSFNVGKRILIPRGFVRGLLQTSDRERIEAEMSRLAKEQDAIILAQPEPYPYATLETIWKRQRDLWNQYVSLVGYAGTHID